MNLRNEQGPWDEIVIAFFGSLVGFVIGFIAGLAVAA